MVRSLGLGAVAGLLAVGVGCATMGTVQTAMTAGEGNFEAGIEPSIGGATSTTDAGGATLAYFNVSGRYGVTDRIDLGARVGTSGGVVLTKFMLTNPEKADAVQVSLAPSGGGFAIAINGGGAGLLYFEVPLIVGVPVGEHELVITPKLHDWLGLAGGGGDAAGFNVVSLGGSVGFAARAGPRLRLLPELALLVPVWAAAGASGGGADAAYLGVGGFGFQGTFGFLIGGRDAGGDRE